MVQGSAGPFPVQSWRRTAEPAPVQSWRRIAFLASAAAAGVHLGAARPHFHEYAPAGWFMLAAGLAQLVWAVWISRGAPRRVVIAGMLGNAGVVSVWLMSRTAGMPWGPEPWMREHVHATDALATVLELLVVAAAFALTIDRTPDPAPVLTRLALAGAFAATMLAAHADAVYEQLAATATLTLAVAARAVISVAHVPLTRLIEGRRHEDVSFGSRMLVGRRAARAGLGAGG